MPSTVTLRLPGADRTTAVPTGTFIDGRWIDTAHRLEVVDPATGQVVAEVADAIESTGYAPSPPPPQDGYGLTSRRAPVATSCTPANVMTLESGKPLAESAGEV
jgi:succinate-semialdehyde dehydrogenase / glutarate-semialdehyde dehydrogenase